MTQRQSLAQRLRRYYPSRALTVNPVIVGKLTRVVGLTLEAVGCNVSLGSRCLVSHSNGKEIEAEVVGFDGPRFLCRYIVLKVCSPVHAWCPRKVPNVCG